MELTPEEGEFIIRSIIVVRNDLKNKPILLDGVEITDQVITEINNLIAKLRGAFPNDSTTAKQ
jgi:hypothetical protein